VEGGERWRYGWVRRGGEGCGGDWGDWTLHPRPERYTGEVKRNDRETKGFRCMKTSIETKEPIKQWGEKQGEGRDEGLS